MNEICQLSERGVPKCDADTPLLTEAEMTDAMRELPEWQVSDDARSITRRVQVKGYAKAVYLANLAAFLADQAGHHPDVSFGWGYCKLRFTTHAAGGLTEGDVICAAKFDAAIG